ncbi:uncharacterized protein LOC110466332 isoform X3 [Mizuhopecten yessoensis]|uniref:Rho guanine nucleotide exchange factor 33 n=1 Tax=Mizuhopecten yessoensis TaxID=6573 RepID=A0A210PPD9_MIZYE|nr:uncharacterized protein LOC110466332 isoform X3 [Mizuhopecten yessoensis]OWF38369.1 Rho guanine nucleotide exchange factor 33 [Mizuhopecten yessoensis]
MGRSAGRKDSRKHDHKSPGASSSPDVWCIFRVRGGARLSDTQRISCCDKATGVCEGDLPKRRCWQRGRRCCEDNEFSDDKEDIYTTAGESSDMDDSSAENSYCSYTNSATMDQMELEEQLALVQEMVQEMKTGFATAMEELANIQFGDQTLQQQMVTDRSENRQRTVELTDAVQSLKVEIENLSGQLKEVSEAQRSLEVKVDNVKSFDKEAFLDELQNLGVVNDQARYQVPTSTRSSEVQPKDVSPLVHPYLASLAQDKGDDSDAQSVTALACKSLNLSQALHEKCLHLDLSASSDDDETIRHAQNARLALLNPDTIHLSEAKAHFSKKIPPHEKVLEEVQREKCAQEAINAERSYCSQLWTLIDAVIRPLRQEELMAQRDLNTVFPSYLPHLYEQHCIMLRKMEERMLKWKYTGLIGDVFVKFTDAQEGEGLSVYKDYINDFPTVISNMNYWFTQSARFRDIMGSSSLATSSVIPLLLAPLQQIPKYSLLIKNMLKHTEPDHPDRYYLDTALTRLKSFLGMMNNDLEHAMQFMNVNKDPIDRSRDYGNSIRSRSSGSSCEANQVSSARDSGIHSNGEDTLLRQPASPNTTRRYVLQVLRDRREREAVESLNEIRERPRSAIPVRSHVLGYGSHPDLTTRELTEFVSGGTRDLPSYAPYQSASKMYSSMTKIQQTRDPPKSPEKPPRKIKIRRRPDSQKSSMSSNSNYLRPLTPHLPFNSTSRQDVYNENDIPRSHSANRRLRSNRPASSIDFTGGDSERRNKMIEQISFHPPVLSTPRDHASDGRSHSELHLSLQRLMAERDRSDALENDRYDRPVNHFQPLDVSSVHSSEVRESYPQHNQRSSNYGQEMHQQQEDYGIFGDDDEEESYQHSPRDIVTSQRSRPRDTEVLGSDRNFVSADSGLHLSRSGNVGPKVMSGEQLAASLALSLGDQISTEEEDSTSSHDHAHLNSHGQQGSMHLLSSQAVSSNEQLDHTPRATERVESSNGSHKLEPRKPARGVNSVKRSSVQSSYDKGEVVGDSVIHVINDSSDNPRLSHPSGIPIDLKTDNNINQSNINTLERARKYVVPAEKPSEDTMPRQQIPTKLRTSFSDINRNELKVSSVDSNNVIKRTALPVAQQSQRTGLSPSNADGTHIPTIRGRRGSASVERTPKKLPVVMGRLSQPNLEQMTAGAKFPSPPVSPTKMTAKDTKIPLYTPNRAKKDRAPMSPRDPMSKSNEDISKLKKKTGGTAFKQSIKNFFGRKRPAAGFEDTSNVELEEGQV